MSDELHRYLAGAMAADEDAAFEERLFDDPGVAEEARRAMAVRSALREMARRGPLVPVLHPSEVARFVATASATEHHPVGGHIRSSIADEAFVIAHVPADLAGVERVDVQFCTAEGVPYFVVRDAPFADDEVVILCESHVARTTAKLRIRVLDPAGVLRGEVSIEDVPPT